MSSGFQLKGDLARLPLFPCAPVTAPRGVVLVFQTQMLKDALRPTGRTVTLSAPKPPDKKLGQGFGFV